MDNLSSSFVAGLVMQIHLCKRGNPALLLCITMSYCPHIRFGSFVFLLRASLPEQELFCGVGPLFLSLGSSGIHMLLLLFRTNNLRSSGD